LQADLGGDLSTSQLELVKRAALLGAIVEDAECAWLENKPANLSVYGMLVDRQRRVLEALGMKRQPRDVTPNNNTVDLKALVKRVKAKAAGTAYARS
jgi:hypothetical protein